MPEPAGPRDVIERLIQGISEGRWQELHELYAEDAVVEYPFAMPADPPRLVGRAKIQRYFAAVARQPLELKAHHIVLHETGDPEVVIAEYDYDGLVTTTGRSFQVSNIQVSRVRNGQIVTSRDYHNHPVMAEATSS
ncbi:nuclear transport factor 2 family protein [Actinomadura craniellae]|nr:nuclear transport factor 2 family protein [Actinomadura craniellae]